MTVTNYHIGEGYSCGEMIKEAQRLIDMGWVPKGGVSVSWNDGRRQTIYSQAFIFSKQPDDQEATGDGK